MWSGWRARGRRRNTWEACHCYRVVFSWQAQHSVHVCFTISWQAQHLVTWRRYCFDESQRQGCENMTQSQKSWLLSILWVGRSVATKIIIFELCKNDFKRKTRNKSSILSFKVSKLDEVLRETLVLKAGCVKIAVISRETLVFTYSSWEVLLAFCTVARMAETRVAQSSSEWSSWESLRIE